MPIIDIHHPLKMYAKVYDADGNLVHGVVSVDTDAGKCRRILLDEHGKVRCGDWRSHEDGSISRDILSEVVEGKFTVKFAGVPEDQCHLIPPGF